MQSLTAALGWQPHLLPGFQPGNSPGKLVLSVSSAFFFFFPLLLQQKKKQTLSCSCCCQGFVGKTKQEKERGSSSKINISLHFGGVRLVLLSLPSQSSGLRAGALTWGGLGVHPVEKHQQGVEGKGQAAKDHPTHQETVAAPIMDDLQTDGKPKKGIRHHSDSSWIIREGFAGG